MLRDNPELKRFLSMPVPAPIARKHTLFDISGHSHSETVISKWYAYFMLAENNHGLERSFIESILSLVEEKTGRKMTMNFFQVDTEVTTINKKRIDILITDESGDHGKYIIIENKIFHRIDNDLIEYWQHCKCDDDNKVGILLTLAPEIIQSDAFSKFINLTHAEVIRRISVLVMQKTLNTEQNIMFDHFKNAIINLSKDLTMNDQVKFYQENSAKIDTMVSCRNKAYEYVFNHVKVAGDQMGLKFSGLSDDYRYLSFPENDFVCYTIILNSLFTASKTITIVIEIYGEGLKHIEKLDKCLVGQIVQTKLNHKRTRDRTWIHYFKEEYSPNSNDFENLSQYISDKINSDFKPLMIEIISKIQIFTLDPAG